jgi:hypothetical protein
MTVTLGADATLDTVVNSGTGTVSTVHNAQTGLVTITLAANGATDNISLASASSVNGGVQHLAINRFTVSGFGTADTVTLDQHLSKPTLTATSVLVIQATTAAGSVTNVGSVDLIILGYEMAGGVDVLSGSTNGSALLAANGAIVGSATTSAAYVLAYDNGNAYLYQFGADGSTSTGGSISDVVALSNATMVASDIQLIGVFTGVALNALGASNFLTGL